MQLHLKTDRKYVGYNPVSQIGRGDIVMRRREEHIRNATNKCVLVELEPSPLVIFPATDNELHLVVRRQRRHIGPQIPVRLFRVRRLDIHDTTYRRWRILNLHGTTGLQLHIKARVAKHV